MKFDREKLSDCFDSISLAGEIRRQFGLNFEPAPLYEIAEAVGIWNVKEELLNSIEGALVVPDGKVEGEIILNASQYPERKRFTLAHEIGHFVHPLHHPDNDGRFNCSNDDIFKAFGRENIPDIEDEANDFASELLIPKYDISTLTLQGCELNFGQIIDFCEALKVSKAFAIRRIQPFCKTPIAFIFSKNGVIRYAQSDNFPFMKVWSKDILPKNTISLSDLPDNTISKKVEVDSSIWLAKASRVVLYEQLFVQENGYRITMLTIA